SPDFNKVFSKIFSLSKSSSTARFCESKFPQNGGINTITHTSVLDCCPSGKVAVTVYLVVKFGEAVGFGQSVQLKPAAGDHEKVAPDAGRTLSAADCP